MLTETTKYLLQMKNISKTFPGVTALDDVTLNIEPGKVMALIGENGAGKSTLMKVLIGMYKAERGEVILRERKASINSPKEALQQGISMIHQELNPIPSMTVAENIFVGREPCIRYTPILNRKELRRRTEQLLREIGVNLNPDSRLKELSVAETQMVEIVKAISYNAEIIIMDEPTSAISDREVVKLFEIIRRLTAKGAAVIYISHKLDEIFKIADSVTVLRDGKFVDCRPVSKMNKQTLISLMVGRELKNIFPKEPAEINEIMMEVKGLTKKGKFKNVNFQVRRGEILGIAGLMGAGRTELVETIFGIRRADEGEIIVKGKSLRIGKPQKAINHGIALVSEDRKLFGLNLKTSVKNNISLVNLNEYCYLNQLIKLREERRVVDQQIKILGIKTPTRNQIVNSLSGGNQQKVVLAKWILANPEILILDEPTRGIDVGAKAEIHKLMSLLVKEGKAIVMISSEMPEILGMSDRVLVLHEGRVTGEFVREELEQEKIMACATGHMKGEQVI